MIKSHSKGYRLIKKKLKQKNNSNRLLSGDIHGISHAIWRYLMLIKERIDYDLLLLKHSTI